MGQGEEARSSRSGTAGMGQQQTHVLSGTSLPSAGARHSESKTAGVTKHEMNVSHSHSSLH